MLNFSVLDRYHSDSTQTSLRLKLLAIMSIIQTEKTNVTGFPAQKACNAENVSLPWHRRWSYVLYTLFQDSVNPVIPKYSERTREIPLVWMSWRREDISHPQPWFLWWKINLLHENGFQLAFFAPFLYGEIMYFHAHTVCKIWMWTQWFGGKTMSLIL